jgi:cardiolipin synthase
MMHAKTAVADGQWARVGSTNLNLQSWIGNWELDVAVEDRGFGGQMEAMFERDLSNSTEVLLEVRRRLGRMTSSTTSAGAGPGAAGPPPVRGSSRGRPARAAAGALRLGNTVGAALTATRPLGAAEASTLAYGGAALLGLAGLAAWWPHIVAVPVAAAAVWLGLSLFGAAWRARRTR